MNEATHHTSEARTENTELGKCEEEFDSVTPSSDSYVNDGSLVCDSPNLSTITENRMKLVPEDMTLSRVDPRTMPHSCCSLLSNDLSASLPNLLVDKVFAGHGVTGSSNEINSMCKGSLSDISNDKLRFKTMSLEDCQQCSRNEKLSSGRDLVKHDLPVSLSENNRLSAVLESISLVYLPQTKQLVSTNVGHVKQETTPCNNNIQGNVDNSLSLSERECPEGAESSVHSKNGINPTLSLPEHMVTEENDPQIPSLELAESLHELATENNPVILSQESDVSAQSHSTVINCHGIGYDNLTLGSRDSAASQIAPQDIMNDIEVLPPEDLGVSGELSKLNIIQNRENNITGADIQQTSSLTRTDASSFSSISSLSTGTEHSASYSDAETSEKPIVDSDEAGFVDINLDARSICDQNFVSRNNSQDSGLGEGSLQHSGASQSGAKPKKKGLSFLTRSIFSRKTKDSQAEGGPLGWRLFGKIPPKEPVPEVTIAPDSIMVNSTVENRQDNYTRTGAKVKKTDVEAPSTTALILENRPQGLPSKDPEEELRHRQQYEAMVEAAKKKEMREAKLRKKQLQQQLKHEDALSAAVKTWNTEILPNWDNMKLSKRARDLWWNGIPPSVRGKVWKLAFGNDLNLTSELYEICMSRAKDRLKIMKEAGSDTDSISSFSMFADLPSSKEASVELIKLDVSRTFPQLCIFQKRGPYHELLQGLLGAYACYRPDVGYVQGMSFIAAVLLLNMDVDDAFICFANLLNRPCQIAFFRLDESLMNSYFETYEAFFEENLPRLFSYFKRLNITSNLYIIDWLFTLYAKSLPLDVASRVWDVFCRDGEEFLFRTALGILKLHEDILLNMDFIHLAQFLTRLPEHISSDKLFNCIDSIHMTIDKRKFYQVLSDAQEQNKPTTES